MLKKYNSRRHYRKPKLESKRIRFLASTFSSGAAASLVVPDNYGQHREAPRRNN